MQKTLSICFAIFVSTLLYAQEAKTLFLNIPDSIMPLLTEVNRADCIDFLESNMKAQIKNKFDDTSEMTELSHDYIRIQMTPNSSWEMKVLPISDTSNVICVINTACAPACDSNVRFYDTNWQELNTTHYLTLPDKDDFFVKASQDDLHEYEVLHSKADITFIKANLSSKGYCLNFILTTPEYMSKEDAKNIAKYLHPSLTYCWNKRFEFVP